MDTEDFATSRILYFSDAIFHAYTNCYISLRYDSARDVAYPVFQFIDKEHQIKLQQNKNIFFYLFCFFTFKLKNTHRFYTTKHAYNAHRVLSNKVKREKNSSNDHFVTIELSLSCQSIWEYKNDNISLVNERQYAKSTKKRRICCVFRQNVEATMSNHQPKLTQKS